MSTPNMRGQVKIPIDEFVDLVKSACPDGKARGMQQVFPDAPPDAGVWNKFVIWQRVEIAPDVEEDK